MSESIPAILRKKLDRHDEQVKEEFKGRMQKARALALGELSPRQVGDIRVVTIMAWVYKCEKSTIPILERVGGSNQYGKVQKLIDRGLLRVQNAKTGGYDGLPKKIVTLTLAGLDFIERHSEKVYPYRYAKDPSALNQNCLYHDIVLQVLTLIELEQGRIVDFEPETRGGQRNQTGLKKHDMTWLVDTGIPGERAERFGIEFENSKKTGRAAHTFTSRVVDCLTTLNEDERIDTVLLYTNKPAIEKEYKEAMAVGAPITEHRKNSGGYWEELPITRKVPKEIAGRFLTVCKDDFLALLRPAAKKA
ncbi:hypothetical protein G6692_03685 [Polynucleobacter paneuropaeus]|jgi:hypothetical protein|uniref:Uncharacterized protein n=1 Tax=Polynucleobacter paneuropaeus TaxID=2527775 RepID=A0AAE2YK63_9BURK|nr:hypothetical protein [Polynucleobacter paneuropaeus]MBT8591010.1 hypothetical protein [Polynucleobacter paneuropaeus]MBT8596401.1 hypothetical protein [Polynucleobacter paneuropaeus]MBT8598214.1 hypothetical protein [Polynucleobacter paneuropaeus]